MCAVAAALCAKQPARRDWAALSKGPIPSSTGTGRAGQPIGARECARAEALQSQVVASALASELSAGAPGRKRLLDEGYAAAPEDELGARGRGYAVARFAAAGAVTWLGW